MTGAWKQLAVALSGVVILALPAVAADAPKVLSVLTVKVKGDQDAYLQKVKQFNAIAKRVDSGASIRVWRATLAGNDTGLIFVGIEYASMEALAKGMAKTAADPEWQRLRKELDASGTREVV